MRALQKNHRGQNHNDKNMNYKLALSLPIALTATASLAAEIPSLTVKILNTQDLDRYGETVEFDLDSLAERLGTKSLRVVDATSGQEIPSQMTHDGKLLFQTSVSPSGCTSVKIQPVAAFDFGTFATGKVYPQRLDDFCWENDVAAFRAYGPALQDKGERGFGYDIFLKRGTDRPVIDHLYHLHFDTQPKYSYHKDHGYGMDCYAVGATLGAGVAALVANDSIMYPWCYDKVKVLDQGPIRLCAELIFRPVVYNGDTIIEHRTITLDKGSNLNHTTVRYEGLNSKAPIVMGIVMHDNGPTVISDADGYMAYVDPTQSKDNGEVYMGAIFSGAPSSIKVEEEGKARHLLSRDTYDPSAGFEYYWGYGWNRGNIPSFDQWQEVLRQKSRSIKYPLVLQWGE